MLEKVLRYAGELEKLEADILSDKQCSKFMALENELTLNDFVLLDDLQMCAQGQLPVWMKDIWPKSVTAN